ncbi:MAG: hypothetical protein KF852_10170 [Saprospiraceae bacterium]|nr:hypothetical protein [Saprospiraceae bacterium]
MNKLLLILFLAASLSAALVSCSKLDDFSDFDTISGTAEYAVPLVNTDISLGDLLKNFEENSSLTIDPDGTLRFNYSGDVITQNSSFIFAAIQHTLSQFPIIPITSQRMALPFSSPGGLDLDRIDCKAGTVAYYFANPHPESVTATMTFPDVKRNGQPLRFIVTLPGYSGTGDLPFSTNILFPASVNGYTITSETDSIYIEYEAIRAGGISDTLANVLVSIQNLEFTYAEGYLGNFVHEGGRDTILIDFFDNWIRGDVYFEDPTVTFNIENSFGIPTRSIVNVFNVITVNGEVLPLQSSYVTDGIDFPYPAINEVGQVKSDRFVFNKNNSNIDVILGAGPIAVDYDVNALTNPDNNAGIRGFITDESYYRVRVEVELPLFGRASGFVAQDTIDINFGDLSTVDFAEFKLFTENELPLDIDLQAYFIDDNGAVLDSLLASPQRVVQGAPVNAQGIATTKVTRSTLIPFDAARFERVKTARRVVINAAFSTINNGTVSIKALAQQNIKIKLGAKLGMNR